MNVEKHFKDIWSGVITGELWASSNVKHKFFLMFENQVWGRLLMVLKDYFRIMRLRSRGTARRHGYFMLGIPGLLLNECCRIFGCCAQRIMMF